MNWGIASTRHGVPRQQTQCSIKWWMIQLAFARIRAYLQRHEHRRKLASRHLKGPHREGVDMVLHGEALPRLRLVEPH
jgi:hypothetical protein